MSCDENGAFVGVIPLLRQFEADGRLCWEPRDTSRLSKQLASAFGVPIDMAPKTGGLKAICNALNDGDVSRAQIAAVLLGIPDPPPLVKAVRSRDAMIKFIRLLHRSGMIKADWNADEHPRWPAGAPDSQGGEFAPKGSDIAAQSAQGDEQPDSVAPSEFPQSSALQSELDDAVYHPGSDSVELDPTASSPEQLQQNKQQHDDEVDRQVRLLESKSYGALKVTKEVSFIGRNGVPIRVDYVVSRWLPDGFAGVWLVPWHGVDVKTGRGGLTDNQRLVYPKIGSGTWVTPVGNNAVAAGFTEGEEAYFPIVYGDAVSTTEH